MKRMTKAKTWKEAYNNLSNEMGYGHIWERLNEIENILGDEYELDHLRKLIEADKKGRCVVFPCKIGDTIYTIGASICKWREIDHCDEYCDGWQYRDCWEGTSVVIERKFGFYDIENIGKTAFFTYEEAKEKLKELQDDEKE